MGILGTSAVKRARLQHVGPILLPHESLTTYKDSRALEASMRKRDLGKPQLAVPDRVFTLIVKTWEGNVTWSAHVIAIKHCKKPFQPERSSHASFRRTPYRVQALQGIPILHEKALNPHPWPERSCAKHLIQFL